MASLIEGLISILTEQIENYDQLLLLSKEKKQYIINNEIEILQKITAAENTIIGKNQRLENKMEKNIKDIASVLNKDEDSLTITEIAELIKSQPEYKDLIKVKNKLRSIIDELKLENDQNKILIQNSLDYIDFSINIIHSELNIEDSYYSNNGERINIDKSFFDTKQ